MPLLANRDRICVRSHFFSNLLDDQHECVGVILFHVFHGFLTQNNPICLHDSGAWIQAKIPVQNYYQCMPAAFLFTDARAASNRSI